jgi:hypothetical protein
MVARYIREDDKWTKNGLILVRAGYPRRIEAVRVRRHDSSAGEHDHGDDQATFEYNGPSRQSSRPRRSPRSKSGSRHRLMMAACGPDQRLRCGWPGSVFDPTAATAPSRSDDGRRARAAFKKDPRKQWPRSADDIRARKLRSGRRTSSGQAHSRAHLLSSWAYRGSIAMGREPAPPADLSTLIRSHLGLG